MAELIPINYRVRMAQKNTLVRWCVWGVVILAGVFVGISYAWNWQRQQGLALSDLQNEYRIKSTLIFRSQELRQKRQDLAARQQRIDKLRDDKIVLSLFNHVSAAKQEFDCIEQINIDARQASNGDKDGYFVRVVGQTEDPAELAALMKRLGSGCVPPVNVTLEQTKRETFLDGHVMHFSIICDRPQG